MMRGHAMLMAVAGGSGSTSPYESAILASLPISFWPLDSARTTSDIIGSNNYSDLTSGGAQFNGAALYSGSSSSLNISSSTNLYANYAQTAIQTFTVEFILTTSTTQNLVLLENNRNDGWSIQNNGNSQNGIYQGLTFIKGGGAGVLASPSTNMSSKTHIAISTVSGGASKIYINGVLKASINQSTAAYSSSSYLNLGSRDGTYGFIGQISGLAFFNRELSSAEIANHSSAAFI